MATSIAQATELGFAEFASTLISETLNAIITSILIQEKQAAQLEQQAKSTPEAYAAENLTDDLVRAEVIRLFPSATNAENKSSVDVGEPYINGKEAEESPAIFSKIGYKITKEDVTGQRGKILITDTGYRNIFAAAKLTLARQQLAVIIAVVARGIPRVYVDNGHITSKLTLRFETNTTAPKTVASTGAKIAGLSLRKVFAQPVNPNRPEFLTLKTDVLSEVEITFKTVVP